MLVISKLLSEVCRPVRHVIRTCSLVCYQVLQGDNVNAPEYGTYCGNSIPPAITSTGYALTLIFTSNRYVQKGGFTASYSKSTSCEKIQMLSLLIMTCPKIRLQYTCVMSKKPACKKRY